MPVLCVVVFELILLSNWHSITILLAITAKRKLGAHLMY